MRNWLFPLGALLGLALLVATSSDGRGPITAEPGTIADPGEVYDPVIAGEPLPRGFRQLLPRDAIFPIYEPTFVSADRADWGPDVLVIGVAVGEQAKAYPVSILNGREMVVDRLAGVPILVTW